MCFISSFGMMQKKLSSFTCSCHTTCSPISFCQDCSTERCDPSCCFRGELIGVEYLYSQQCKELREDIGRDPDAPDDTPDDESEWEDDEVSYLVKEEEIIDPTVAPVSGLQPHHGLLSRYAPPVAPAEPLTAAEPVATPPSPPLSKEPLSEPGLPSSVAASGVDDGNNVVIGPDRAPGYDHVVRLARERLLQGRFKASHSKTTTCSGTESLKRCLLGQGTGPAQWPNASRLVEAICLELCFVHPRGRKLMGFRMNRWAVVLYDYGRIRSLTLNSPGLVEATALQLFEINQRTLSLWHNNFQKKQEQVVLSMQIPAPNPSILSATPQPEPRQIDPKPEHPRPFEFITPPDRSGQAARRGQRQVSAAVSYLQSQLIPQQPGRLPVPPQPRLLPHSVLLPQPPQPVLMPQPPQPVLMLQPPAPPQHALMPQPPQPVLMPQPPPPPRPGHKHVGKVLSRSTQWRRRKAAEALARRKGLPISLHVTHTTYKCTQCGQPRTREFGHSRRGSSFFCAKAEGKTVEEWQAEGH
ncbi:hypothetical protein AMEX_G6128 [Astyanax mexicanus]|uniref:Uncharacterized protein n=1 Tax=Astyanax mexicanus TaxID=7994 RepID=A0A8T2M557_ASTMX|nr:hypothetical protein AMEX_G6128 [Astyanax mexicanus]